MTTLRTQPDRKANTPTLRACCIHEQFEAQAKQTPHAIAITWNGKSLSYGDLDERSTAWAAHLLRAGVRPGQPVALFLERSFDMVVAILAVLKAGGAYVPLDLAYPRERLSFILSDVKPAVLLTQAALVDRLPETSARVLVMDSDPGPATRSEPSKLPNVDPQDSAYIIYTSGSTGKPKGVVVTHSNVVRLLRQTEHWFQFNHNDVMPLFHSYAFDMSVWELWAALFYGGRLAIVPYELSRSPHDFYEFIAREKVTLLNQTPSAFRQLIWAEQAAPERRTLSLRFVTCGGEALDLNSLKPWFDIHGDSKPVIVNMYGITETTVHTTYRPIRRSDLAAGLGSVIGVPIPDLQVHLLDEQLRPVPPGEPGEICVGGAGVARGYLNRPELTARRFVPDPFSKEEGARLYRSGDLARLNSHGELEYLGRMDHQVKLRGFRIELGEIESALNRHRLIRESLVVAREDAPGEKQLAAYIVPASGEASPAIEDLREHLARSLPEYMVPASFTFLPSLPLTHNGKVDRRALPRPATSRPALKTPYVPAESEFEHVIASLWKQVLGLQQVGMDDNYFELGGDSIRSIRLLAALRHRAIQLSLADLFQNPTIRALASIASRNGSSAGTLTSHQPDPFSLISAADRAWLPADAEDAYPVATLQLGMFFHNELDPQSAIYHDVFSFRVRTAYTPPRFAAALERLLARHPILRTSFHLAGYSQPLQVVHRKVDLPLSVEDLSGATQAELDERLVHWVEAEKRRPFDRTRPPLARFHIQVRGPGEFQFIFSFHHACIDGWSLATAVTELLTDYQSAGSQNQTPATAYRDFVALERATLASETTRRFWKEYLDEVVPQRLPRWPASMCVPAHEQARSPEFKVPRQVLAGLTSLAVEAGVPLKSVLLAAHLHVLAFLQGSGEVLTGLVSNGRPETLDAEKTLGLFLNTLPVRHSMAPGSWVELARQAYAAEQQVLPHRRFPMAEIQKVAGGMPLLDSAFDFVHFHVYKDLAAANLDFAEGHYFEANNLTTYTTFMLDSSSDSLELHLDYDPNAVCQAQIEQVCAYYLATLEAMATSPGQPHHQFSPLSDAERRLLLQDFNRTTTDYPRDICVHRLFEECAKATPEACAVVCGDVRITYAGLDSRAQALAADLRAMGVGPGSHVGVCVERSPGMVIALLAVLKAGGAYVPIDPAYPRDRILFMLRDSGAQLLVTESHLLPAITPDSCRAFCIDARDAFASAARRPRPEAVEPDANSLAYVIYTSGSTGQPKGVQITHRSVVNLLLAAAGEIGFTASDRLLAITTLSFDIAALEIFMPLVTGGQLHLASRDEASDPVQLAALIDRTGASVLQATPVMWRMLLETGWRGSPQLRAICGGEALKQDLAEALQKRVAGLWNFYGPTETTIWSTAAKLTPGQTVTVGKPLANTQAYILNRQLQLVPVCSIGELYLSGDGLARGYWNRPELDAERFIPNPFATEQDSTQRLYRTGDLARWLPDGSIECLGRLDAQLKIRGFRIEPGEIEATLRQHAGIADAIVTTRQDDDGNSRLVGYVVSRNGPPSILELRDFLRTRLPSHMVPAQFVVVKGFPLTPNGKLDVRKLPVPEAPTASAPSFVPPRTQREQSLAEIWRDVLSVTRVGIDDDLFELGADSLSATRAYARISQSLDSRVQLKDLFEKRTVRSLAAFLEESAPQAPRALRIARQTRLVPAT